MVKYKVKNFSNTKGWRLQELVKEWLESREHIIAMTLHFWVDGNNHYATITYQEVDYVG